MTVSPTCATTSAELCESNDLECSPMALSLSLSPSSPSPHASQPICRICHSHDNLISSPCRCRGSVAMVHRQCLERWLSHSGTVHCDLCACRFDMMTELQYDCWESLQHWATDPQTRCLFRFDLLTFIVANLCIAALMAQLIGHIDGVLDMRRIIEMAVLDEGQRDQHLYIIQWHLVIYYLFAAILLVGHIGSCTFFWREQLRPWFVWWRGVRRIKYTRPSTNGAEGQMAIV